MDSAPTICHAEFLLALVRLDEEAERRCLPPRGNRAEIPIGVWLAVAGTDAKVVEQWTNLGKDLYYAMGLDTLPRPK